MKCATSFAFTASHKNAEGHKRSAYCEQWILPISWGWVGNFRLHFFSHFFFNFKNLSAHLLANKVVAAVFPQNHNFFGTPCIIGTWQPPVKLLIPEWIPHKVSHFLTILKIHLAVFLCSKWHSKEKVTVKYYPSVK